MSHEDVTHPNGDGLRIIQRHMDLFNTPKHSGFNIPIGVPAFGVVSPGEYIKIPHDDENHALADINYPHDVTPVNRILAIGIIYDATRLSSGSYQLPGSLWAPYFKVMTDIVNRMATVYNVSIGVGLLELLLAGEDFQAAIDGNGATRPSFITIRRGTNTSGDPADTDFAGVPTVADLNAMRAAAPASTNDWRTIFSFWRYRVLSFGSGTDQDNRRQDVNDNLQTFYTTLTGGSFGLSPFYELIAAQDYCGGINGAINISGSGEISAGILPFYTDTTVESDQPSVDFITFIMRTIQLTLFRGWGISLEYRSPDAVTGFSVVATGGGAISITWSPPNGSAEYIQASPQDAVYIADDPAKLAIDVHDIINYTNQDPGRSSYAQRTVTSSPFNFSATGAKFIVGQTIYARVRTRSVAFAQFGFLANIVDGEGTAILSAVIT